MNNETSENTKQVDSPEPASAASTIAIQSNKTEKVRLMWLIVVAVCASVAFWFISQNLNSTPKIPKPDFTTANSNVALATAQLLKAVEDKPNSADAWGAVRRSFDGARMECGGFDLFRPSCQTQSQGNALALPSRHIT